MDTRVLADGEAKLDDKGAFTVNHALRFPDPVAQHELVTLSATVDDASGQSISRTASVDFFNAGLLVGLDAPSYMAEANKSFTVTAIAVSPDDAPMASGVAT